MKKINAYFCIAFSLIFCPLSISIELLHKLAGAFQSEVGSATDWDAACSGAALAYNSCSGLFEGDFSIPGGCCECQVVLNNDRVNNYGRCTILLSGEGENQSQTTGADGKAAFSNLPHGMYRLALCTKVVDMHHGKIRV